MNGRVTANGRATASRSFTRAGSPPPRTSSTASSGTAANPSATRKAPTSSSASSSWHRHSCLCSSTPSCHLELVRAQTAVPQVRKVSTVVVPAFICTSLLHCFFTSFLPLVLFPCPNGQFTNSLPPLSPTAVPLPRRLK